MLTTIPVGDSKAVKKWSANLFLEYMDKSYWERKFVGTGMNNVIQRLTDLEREPGDHIQFDLSVQLRQPPVTGDNPLEGKEEQLRFHSDEVYIDQLRSGASIGGRMTRKRTIHDLREIAKARMGEYWAKYFDELRFIYISGARGINEDFIEPTTYAGHATNSIQAPDSGHIVYGGNATAKNNVDSGDIMSVETIEKVATKAKMLRAVDPTMASMVPISVGGDDHFVIVMSPFQTHDMRTASGSKWIDYQKAAAAAEGRNNPIFKGNLGMVNNVVLHEHANVIRFSDYGSSGPPGVLSAARALFMGRQAGVIAYGAAGGLKMQWNEELTDHKNNVAISSGTIMGLKKARFNGKDFGVIAIDTYAANPNA